MLFSENRIPLFRSMRERNFEYIDKTNLITEFLDREGVKVILLPRPRRFGKSLNISMLKWFFEQRDENLWHLFEGLHVSRAGEKYRKHFQKYPVIHISFKETKANDFDTCFREAKRLIRDMYAGHKSVLEGRLDAADKADFDAIWSGTADDALYRRALKDLTRYLHQVHSVLPIVLIDEYDAGIHAAYTHQFYEQAIGFFASFFLAGLKDNPHLERAVMTGILRVSPESIFSDLNNIGVYSLLRSEFNTCFGFTEKEVFDLLQRGEALDMMEAAKDRIFLGPAVGLLHNTVYEAAPWGITPEVVEQMGMKRNLEKTAETYAEVKKRGIRVVVGGDYGFAWTPQGTNARDLKHFVDLFGYSPMDTIVCATRYGGELMRMGGELGQVREGFLADLLLVDGNPLADIGIMADRSRFAMIMKDGAIYKDPRAYARDVRIAAE